MDSRICLITYDQSHRKTQDLCFQLRAVGYRNIHLAVIPWKKRKVRYPLYNHRPQNAIDISVDEFVKNLDLRMTRLEVEKLHDFFSTCKFEHILIAGAGLLPDDLVTDFNLINAHPGYLPNCKGLDAFKWAILNNQKVGVTTHYVDEQTDEGRLIERRFIPLYREDSFHSFAYRLYETEISLLVDSISMLELGNLPLISLSAPEIEATKRMGPEKEKEMIVRFEKLKNEAPSKHSVDNEI